MSMKRAKRTIDATDSPDEEVVNVSPKKPRIAAVKSAPTVVTEDSDTEDEEGLGVKHTVNKEKDEVNEVSSEAEDEDDSGDDEDEGRDLVMDEFDDLASASGGIDYEAIEKTDCEDLEQTSQAGRRGNPSPLTLTCHCSRPARMLQVRNGMPHNRGQWFGKCATGGCNYWRWADGSGPHSQSAQERFNEVLDAQFAGDDDDRGSDDSGDFGSGDIDWDPTGGCEDHYESPPVECMEEMLREQWREDRRKEREMSVNDDEEREDDEEDFKDWMEEQTAAQDDGIDFEDPNWMDQFY